MPARREIASVQSLNADDPATAIELPDALHPNEVVWLEFIDVAADIEIVDTSGGTEGRRINASGTDREEEMGPIQLSGLELYAYDSAGPTAFRVTVWRSG